MYNTYFQASARPARDLHQVEVEVVVAVEVGVVVAAVVEEAPCQTLTQTKSTNSKQVF